MRNGIIGIVVGLIVGIVVGATVIAPRLTSTLPDDAAAVLKDTLKVGTESAADVEPSSDVTEAEKIITGPTVRWRMASAFPGDLPLMGTQAKRIEWETWRVSDGNLEIRFHEPDSLVPVSDMFAAVKSGAVDAGFIAPANWPRDIPSLQLFGAPPFGPSAAEHLAWIYFGGGQEMLAKLAAKAGVHAIACGFLPTEGAGWFRKPVRTLEDLKGLRVRMTGLAGKVLDRIGAEAIPLPDGEILAALEVGSIDGAEFSMPAVDLKLGLHKLARHYYFPGWHQPATLLPLIVNLDRWNALSAIQKTQINSVCGDNVRHGLAEGGALQTSALLTITKAGVKVGRWPAEVMSALRKAWAELADAQAAQDPDFKAVWDHLSAFRRDYEIWHDLSQP